MSKAGYRDTAAIKKNNIRGINIAQHGNFFKKT